MIIKTLDQVVKNIVMDNDFVYNRLYDIFNDNSLIKNPDTMNIRRVNRVNMLLPTRISRDVLAQMKIRLRFIDLHETVYSRNQYADFSQDLFDGGKTIDVNDANNDYKYFCDNNLCYEYIDMHDNNIQNIKNEIYYHIGFFHMVYNSIQIGTPIFFDAKLFGVFLKELVHWKVQTISSYDSYKKIYGYSCLDWNDKTHYGFININSPVITFNNNDNDNDKYNEKNIKMIIDKNRDNWADLIKEIPIIFAPLKFIMTQTSLSDLEKYTETVVDVILATDKLLSIANNCFSGPLIKLFSNNLIDDPVIKITSLPICIRKTMDLDWKIGDEKIICNYDGIICSEICTYDDVNIIKIHSMPKIKSRVIPTKKIEFTIDEYTSLKIYNFLIPYSIKFMDSSFTNQWKYFSHNMIFGDDSESSSLSLSSSEEDGSHVDATLSDEDKDISYIISLHHWNLMMNQQNSLNKNILRKTNSDEGIRYLNKFIHSQLNTDNEDNIDNIDNRKNKLLNMAICTLNPDVIYDIAYNINDNFVDIDKAYDVLIHILMKFVATTGVLENIKNVHTNNNSDDEYDAKCASHVNNKCLLCANRFKTIKTIKSKYFIFPSVNIHINSNVTTKILDSLFEKFKKLENIDTYTLLVKIINKLMDKLRKITGDYFEHSDDDNNVAYTIFNIQKLCNFILTTQLPDNISLTILSIMFLKWNYFSSTENVDIKNLSIVSIVNSILNKHNIYVKKEYHISSSIIQCNMMYRNNKDEWVIIDDNFRKSIKRLAIYAKEKFKNKNKNINPFVDIYNNKNIKIAIMNIITRHFDFLARYDICGSFWINCAYFTLDITIFSVFLNKYRTKTDEYIIISETGDYIEEIKLLIKTLIGRLLRAYETHNKKRDNKIVESIVKCLNHIVNNYKDHIQDHLQDSRISEKINDINNINSNNNLIKNNIIPNNSFINRFNYIINKK